MADGDQVPSPLLLLRRLDLTGKTLKEVNDGPTEEIYILNPTDRPMIARFAAEFFQTLDEDTGAVLRHGPPQRDLSLEPGDVALVGEVIGWEWDSQLEVSVRIVEGEGMGRWAFFDLKRNWTAVEIDGLGAVHQVGPIDGWK